jgi:hypothetical protein
MVSGIRSLIGNCCVESTVGVAGYAPLPLPPAALDEAPPASVHLGWGKKRPGEPTDSFLRIILALPPDTAESFVREVDENLRRDQMRDLAKSYGKWLVAAVVLFLAAAGGYLYWQERQEKQAIADSETLSAALDKIGSGNAKAAQAELTPLSESSNDVTRASALLGRASLALRQSDRKAASDLFKQVAADDSLPQPFRDLATVRGTMTDFDSLKPDEVIQRLSPMAQPGNPYFGSAGEMTAMAMLAKGDRNGAGQLFAKIAADKQVPGTIRSRAAQIAGSLGVDATAVLPSDLAAPPAN